MVHKTKLLNPRFRVVCAMPGRRFAVESYHATERAAKDAAAKYRSQAINTYEVQTRDDEGWKTKE